MVIMSNEQTNLDNLKKKYPNAKIVEEDPDHPKSYNGIQEYLDIPLVIKGYRKDTSGQWPSLYIDCELSRDAQCLEIRSSSTIVNDELETRANSGELPLICRFVRSGKALAIRTA